MEEARATQVVILSFVILGVFLFLVVGLFFSRWWLGHATCPSPYSRLPLRRASTLSYSSMVKVLRYLYNLHQYDNGIISFKDSAFCRETGRIFQNAVTWYDVIRVDWNFLNKRYPGDWVSWGSLADDQKAEFFYAHDSLEGFQYEFSSRNPSPRQVEPEFAFAKPGPLYADLRTKNLLGWKIVPETELELLIVQKPKSKPIYPNIQQ